MHSILPVAAVVLALIAAGSIAYIAWALLQEVSQEEETSGDSTDTR